MLKLKIILRSLLHQKLNTSIIIVSLAIGMACVNLLALFIYRELNTDNFQTDKNRIYALKCDNVYEKGSQIYMCANGSVEYMKSNFAQLEDFCRVNTGYASKMIVNQEDYFNLPGIIAASSNFFEFFSYELLTNNPKSALEANNNLVISEDLALKFFGTANADGQVIVLENGDKKETMVVTGVFRKPTDNTQLSFDMVRPMTGKQNSPCYIKLRPNAKKLELEAIFKANMSLIPIGNGGKSGQYYLKSLTEAYFDNSPGSAVKSSRDKLDLWIAFVIGLVIIAIASFNYIGLIFNNLLEKRRAYTIQRVNGCSNFGFVGNFMSESSIVIGISFILSLILMYRMTPFFNGLTNSSITPGYFFQTKQMAILLIIVGLLLAITLLFVSLRITANVNVAVLKPGASKTGKRSEFPIFNIIQLASSLALITFSILIVKQIAYITEKPIGLNKQVVEVKIPPQYSDKIQAFKEELMANSSIHQVAVADDTPFSSHSVHLLKYKKDGTESQITISGFYGDEKYASTLGIQILEGSDFTDSPLANKGKFLINESLARLFPGQNLVGKGLPGWEQHIVAGVVKDFHYSSLKSLVEPAFIYYSSACFNLVVKPVPNKITEANSAIARVWQKLIPDYPLNTETIGDQYNKLHQENRKYLYLIGACCIISLFLSMIGLFAISFRNSVHRTKEIGIRKINGAKVSEVLLLLNRGFVKWVAIAFVIATPIAYYAMNKWLESFAYKTSLSWWIFALAGLLALGIALLTVSWQSWKAATRNPVESLRYE